MDGRDDDPRTEFVIARLDERTRLWRYLANVEGDDRIDALDQWALDQGGFDTLDPGVYGSRHKDGDNAWYRRVRAAG